MTAKQLDTFVESAPAVVAVNRESAPFSRREPLPPAAVPPRFTNLAKKKRRRRRLWALTFLLVLVAGGGTWWWLRDPVPAVNPATLTAQVVRRDFSSAVLATGAVKAQVGAEVRVGARISGKVEKLRANIGDAVTAGQVIAELEKADLQAIVAQRTAELELAEARLAAVQSLLPMEIEKAKLDLTRWQASLTLADHQLRRGSRLFESQASSQEEIDLATERKSVAESQLASARKAFELTETRYQEDLRQATADVARARHALETAQVQLSYATLTAPISGVIGSVSTQEGETVAAGMNAPIFVTIIDLNRLQVEAMVDEVDIGKVHPGQRALFTVDAFPAREFPGKVVAIYPKAVLLENVVYYDTVIQIEGNDDKVLRPEMTASVTISLDAKSGVLAIPAKAVKRERGKNFVYTAGDGQPQAQEVKVGWKDGPWIEVVSGLNEGDTILQTAPIEKRETP